MTDTIRLTAGALSFEQLRAFATGSHEVVLDNSCWPAVEAAAAVVERAARGSAPVYGNVSRETPGGYGFGRAAQGLSRHFRVNPRTVNGAAEGSRVNINLRFNLPTD